MNVNIEQTDLLSRCRQRDSQVGRRLPGGRLGLVRRTIRGPGRRPDLYRLPVLDRGVQFRLPWVS